MRDDATLVRMLMRRQAGLSLRIASVFVALLVGLPLLNLYAPGIAGTRIGGFTLTWLLLAVLFYPITWWLSATFVKRSNEIETELAREIGVHEATHPDLKPLELALEDEEESA